jgi:hypothetical protein
MAYHSWPAMMGIENAGNAVVFLARGFFESLNDLGCSFLGVSRPYTITKVLSRCLKSPDSEAYGDDELWAWTLPKRQQGLIAVVIASGRSSVKQLEKCPACCEIMELSLQLASFVDTNLAEVFSVEPEPGKRLDMAIPTGRHQLEWLGEGDILCDENHEFKMVATLTQTINGNLPPAHWCPPRHWLSILQTALEKHDPLTALSLAKDCPSCSETIDVEIDLEGLLLMELESLQKTVLDELYYLARAYHWTEGEILNMPAWRRRYYMHRYLQEVQL